ncbi:hypothetical protein ACP275_01G046000 [Erythranthe tilingii]
MDSESLEELNLNYKEFGDLIENLDKKHHHLEARAGQLAGAYVIFQAIMYMQVFLPSAAAAAPPQQGKRWISISMSALISIAFWITFATTVRDCIRTRGQQESTFEEQQRLYRKIYSIRTGRRESGGGGAAAQRSLSKMFAFVRCQRYAYVGALHSALFSFTVLVSYALLPVGPL